MKKSKIFVILIILIFIISLTNCIYATENKTITELGNEWLDQGENPNSTFSWNGDASNSGFLELAGLLKGLGIFIAVGVGMILGMKFMLSTAEGKAEIKQLLTPYIIGVVIVVGALLIWKLAINIFDI